MKRSADPPPQCALNPQDVTGNNSHQLPARDDRNYLPPNRVPPGRNSFQRYPTAQPKREPQCMSQSWPAPTYDNSNTSWECGGDWSGTPPMKNDFYKQQPRPHPTPSYPSGSEWSPGESSASSSVASGYGMGQPPSTSSAGSYYENNGYYSSGYTNYAPGGYTQPPNYPPQQHYQQQLPRLVDNYQQHQHHHHNNITTNNNRVPSICPPVARQPMPDFQRRQNQNRYAMEGAIPKVQIKQEPEEYQETEGDNFTSLFTKSLTSLYSQDPENAFPEDGNDPDIMILSPLPPPPPPLPQPMHQLESQAAYQRLHSSGGHYTTCAPGEYQESQNNFGFYETKILNCEPQGSVVQEIGSKGDRTNSFRYDRPSFDDMHLYAPNSTDSKAQVKKRKNSMPTAPPENFPENRKKTSRMMSFKSESQWTPNSFGFDGIQIKQEPMDDYNSNELEASIPFQDSSPGSSGNGNSSKTVEPPKDHPKQPPRKRSPGMTCFDRFDKKSTPTNKKVSPLSVYAKVQDSMILSVKCRRYKKRTKPITCKEEVASPCKEEMEDYKRFSLTPDQAARLVMNDLLDRVSLFGERNAIGCTDLSQMEPYQLRDLFMQFCHRSNLDYRDFEDVGSVLRPRIVEDNKMAKNSVRASAIRKRTSTSPAQASIEAPPSEDQGIEPPVVKTRRRRKATNLEEPPFEKRVLRQLPGRAARNNGFSNVVVVERRYSTRNSRGENDVDIVIDLSTDQEDEAGKEAEVRKKSQRLNNRRPARKVPVEDGSLERENEEPVARETSRDRSRQPVERKPAREKSLDKANTPTGKTTSRDQSLDKADTPNGKANSREQSLDKIKPTGKASSRDQSLDKAVSTCREQSLDKANTPKAREQSLEKVSTPKSKANSREQSLDKVKSTGRASARAQSLDKAKPTGRASAREQSLDKGRSTSRASTRDKSLENASKPPKLNDVEYFEDTRRRTRSSEKKVKIPMEIYNSSPRTRRSRLRHMSSNDSSVEIVDISRSSDSASPPLLDAIKIEPSSSKYEVKPKNKNTKRGGKGKKDSPSAEAIKVEDAAEAEPPVLRRSVKRKRTLDSIAMEPPSLHVSADTTKRRNSVRMEPPALPVSAEKIKTKTEIKMEPLSPTENDEKPKFEIPNGAIKAEVADYNLASSINQKVFKPKFEEIPKNATVKSGSSKRKQGGPTKFLKESFKAATFPTFLESNSNPNNLTSDAEQSNNNKFCNSNSLSKFSSSKLFNNITASAMPEPANSSESLKERYRKSFCTEPLRNTFSKRTEEKKPVKFNPFLKSNKHLKETLTKTPALKSEQSISNQRSANSNQEYLFPSTSSGLMVKVKDEPLSEEDTPAQSASTSTGPVFTKIEMEKRSVINKLQRRRSSQCSDSEPQVVLTKLPDVQVDLQNGSVAYELVKKCEEEQERMDAVAKAQELSDYDSDEEKPLMLLRNSGWKQDKQSAVSASNCVNEQDSCGKSSASMNSLKNSTPVAIKPENPKNKRVTDRRRYSESEDSDCGLVIDLDRRLSVEECVPSSAIINSNTDEDLTETEDMDSTRPENPTPVPDNLQTTTTTNGSPTNDPPTKIKEEPVSPTAETRHSSLFRDATEEAHILLELSRGGMPPLVEGVATGNPGKWEPVATGTDVRNQQLKVEIDSTEQQVKEKDESILRTLLLENGDGAVGTSQDTEPSTSSESKHVPSQESMRLPSYPEFPANSSTEIDEKQMMDELQQNSDQMSSDATASFLPASYAWCLRDPQAIREVIQKLKDEIRQLQCMAEQRDRERTSIVCFKRLSNVCRYKEEILKRLLKKCTANTKDPSELGEQKSPTTSHPNDNQPIALTSSSSNGIPSRLSSALTGGITIKPEMPSATVTSGESYSSNSGENLPTVATMVANATENYGVDLRTVTSRRPAGSSKTILQEALSSKEPIYQPVATRSPLPSNERPPDSVRVVQNSPLAFRTSSPLVPELPRTSHLSRRLLASSSSPSQSSLPTELRHSSYSPHQRTSYMGTSGGFEATATRHASPSPSRQATPPKCSPRSSPKSNSFSMWGKLEAERNTSIDLRTTPGSPNFSRSRPADPRSHQRSTSLDPRAIHLPSSRLATNPFSSPRPASTHGSSHRSASIDLRTNQASTSHLNPAGLTNGHSSFMIVPPPTTLQSAFQDRGHHRSRSEGRSSDKEKALNGQVERIYERRNEEDPQPRFVPLAGPLTAVAPSSEFPKCSGCGISRGRYVCSGCETQLYCSAKCQTLRWAEHSKTCSSTHRKDDSKSYK